MKELFGGRLRSLRKAAGITQQELADRLGVHLQTVSKWERGITEPDFSVLGELSSALGLTLEKFLGREEKGPSYTGRFAAPDTGKALASARRARGLSQEEVGNKVGVSSGIVSKWERGIVCPNAEQLCALSDCFALPVSKLYYGIADGARTELPAQAARRKRYTFLWAGVAVLFCIALIFGAVFLPRAFKEEVFSVSVDGQVFEIGSGDWFTPASSAREGYELVGFLDEKGLPVSFPRQVTGDTAYTALYAPIEYAVDYWLNGGALAPGAQYAITVESGTLQLPTPYKSGASFEGWYLTPDYTGDPVQSIACAAADVKVYAKWSDTVYTVRYELGGGALSAENPSVVTAEEELALAAPLREGYLFLGWYDAPSGGNRLETVGGKNAQNLTLYALWQQSGAQFPVVYDAGDGTLLGNNPNAVGAGEIHALYGAQKTGYDFIGWNTAADGGGTWYTQLCGVQEALSLHAVYRPRTYTIVYELDRGTYYEGVNPNAITYGEAVSLRPVAKAGHTFLGWFDAATGGNEVTQIDEGNLLRLHTLYARFEENEYSVFLDGNGGQFSLGDGQISQGALTLRFSETFTLPGCVLAGYDFLGWKNERGETVQTIDSSNIGDMVLTASYREAGLTYTLTYEPCGGTLKSLGPVQIGYGQRIPLPAPQREGYLFLGWNDRADGSGTYYESTPEGRESDLTLYAIWQEITVSGKAENFTYEMGQESVTITGYTGPFGENVDLVIPSYIGGKPVVAVDGRFDRYTQSHPQTFYLHSLIIPETVEWLGANAFNHMAISEPVVIPASVKEIGRECFRVTNFSLCFAENSALKEIGEYAFYQAYIYNIPALPDGLERLAPYAFYDALLGCDGLILPDTLRFVGGYALSVRTWSSSQFAQLYLPSSVQEVEPYAFSPSLRVYTAITEDQTSRFMKGWDNAEIVYLEQEVSGITLRCDGQEQRLAGQAFSLPLLQKEGYTFLGWYDAETDFVNGNYIPLREGVVLEAVFEEKSVADGRSEFTPAILESGKEYEFFVFAYENFYFLPAIEPGAWCRIEYEACAVNRSDGAAFITAENEKGTIASGVSQIFSGEPLFLYAEGPRGDVNRCIYRVKIRVEVL